MKEERDIKLRIQMLQTQAKTLAETLGKALSKKNNIKTQAMIQVYSSRLVNIRDKIEELTWVLNEKQNPYSNSNTLLEIYQIVLPNSNRKESLTVKQIIEKLKTRELTMEDIPSDVSNRVRRAALELKKSN